MGRTKKPCPGCESVVYDREPDKICRTCKRRLEEMRELEVNRPRGKQAYNLARDYFWPGYYEGNTSSDDSGLLRRAIQDLILSLGEEIPFSYDAKNLIRQKGATDGMTSFSTMTILLNKKAADTIPRLDQLIRQLLDGAYKRGVEHGQNLLIQLNSGELTIDQLNEKLERMVNHGH